MKKTALLILITSLFLFQDVLSQAREQGEKIEKTEDEEDMSKANMGIGLGLDYGGIGGRITYLPAQEVGLLLGLGYNFVGLGYNVGAAFRMAPSKRVNPYFVGMYGYNAVIKIVGASQYDKIYYGPSFGFGLEFKSRKNQRNFFNLELLYQVKSQEFEDDISALRNNPAIELTSDPPPIGFCIGYHWGL